MYMQQSINSIPQEGYKTAFKATALFGGTQFILIILKVVKSKLLALWLGPAGIGLMGLFNAAIQLISSISNLGLQSSAVKEIAYAKSQNDEIKIAITVKAIHRWVLVTGFLGVIITIFMSDYLSQWYFKSSSYTLAFIFLSVVVFFNALNQEYLAILQGIRQLTRLIRANLLGALIAFVISIPLLYFLKEEGIVSALIMTAFSGAAVSYFYVQKLNLTKVKQTYRDSFRIGLSAVKLGTAMSISGIMVYVVEFFLRSFILRNGGINDVGLYSAGWAINGQYLGLVFAAMAKDYFPRLSQIVNKNQEVKQTVNQQGEIALLILTPLIIIMIVFINIAIKLLYSGQFLMAVPMVKWLLIGSFIKSGSWGISFVFLAKGDVKTFLFNEIGIKFITLPSYLLGYYYYGLLGIGIAFTFNYVIYFIWVAIVARAKYSIVYSKIYLRLFFILLTVLLSYHITELIFSWNFFLKAFFVIIICGYCLYEFNKRIPLKKLMQ